MDQSLINRIVEAALLGANQPLSLAQLHGLFPEDEPAPPGSVERALELLAEACADRGVELVEIASGFRYQVKADVHPWVARLWTERKTKYTRATLETLALIAYRQPITRGEIEQVRGVAVSSNLIQALEEREWIRVVGHRDVPGKPALFGTTKGFLDYFGLKRLDELPPLSELKDIGELEPQLPLDDAPRPAGAAMEDRPDTAADDPSTGDGDGNGDEENDWQEAKPVEPETTAEAAQDESLYGSGDEEEAAQDADSAEDSAAHENDVADGDTHPETTQDDDAEGLAEGRASSEQKP